jgi:hypothetical protein
VGRVVLPALTVLASLAVLAALAVASLPVASLNVGAVRLAVRLAVHVPVELGVLVDIDVDFATPPVTVAPQCATHGHADAER